MKKGPDCDLTLTLTTTIDLHYWSNKIKNGIFSQINCYAERKCFHLYFYDTCIHRMFLRMLCTFLSILGEGTVDVSHDNNRWREVPGNEGCNEPRILNSHYLYHLNPKMKLIFMMRNPIDRYFINYFTSIFF
jgi:hypothetical protein